MSKESISGKSLERSITSEDILGKEVIDKEGKFIGVVEKVLLDPLQMEFIGIEIDKGFLKNGFSVGKSYLEKITEEAVFLNIRIIYELRGMKVFDKLGEELGHVSKIELYGNKNKLKKIYVKKGFIFGKLLEISPDLIETMGHNIILSVEKRQLVEIEKENPPKGKDKD